MKACKNCKKPKPLAEYHRDKRKRDGRADQCKRCCIERVTAWQKTEHGKTKRKNWARANRTKVIDHRLKTKLKLPHGSYSKMMNAQQSCCAICAKRFPKLCVDHNHRTGVVRALLCIRCNFAVGLMRDSHEIAMNCANYLRLHSVSDAG